MTPLRTENDFPILFRTASEEVCKSTLTSGSLWLRSSEYYQRLEDTVRNDSFEGINSSKTNIPLRIQPNDGPFCSIQGHGKIAKTIDPHYIASFHGTSISQTQHRLFGGHTFGVKNLAKLSWEILLKADRVVPVAGNRFGPVSYQHSALTQSHHNIPGTIIRVDGVPPIFINLHNTDVLRKDPVQPFIEQDEWRIVIFTKQFINDDPDEPLKVQVDIGNFFDYPV